MRLRVGGLDMRRLRLVSFGSDPPTGKHYEVFGNESLECS